MATIGRISVKFGIGDFYKDIKKIQIWLKSGKISGTLNLGLSMCCCW